jgi:hypothetical protein
MFQSGCIQKSYRYGFSHEALYPSLPRTPNLITIGGSHPNIDAIERTVQYPSQVIRRWFPSSRPPSVAETPESLSLKTVQTASDYLDENGLRGVYIDVREYNPREQWRRLQSNQRISPFWKYTGGTVYHIGYCILPGRALGTDSYNGYTSTLSINSTSPANSILHAGYVKKLYDQRYPGTYMAANWLPLVPLFRDASVASDVLTYARLKQNWPLEKELLPEVFAQLGGNTVSQATSLIPGMAYLPIYFKPILTAVGHAAGNLTGTTIAKQREHQMSDRFLR